MRGWRVALALVCAPVFAGCLAPQDPSSSEAVRHGASTDGSSAQWFGATAMASHAHASVAVEVPAPVTARFDEAAWVAAFDLPAGVTLTVRERQGETLLRFEATSAFAAVAEVLEGDFLDAEWATGEGVRPESVGAYVGNDVDAVVLTYRAVSSVCSRNAAYSAHALSGSGAGRAVDAMRPVVLEGDDGAECA